MVQGNIPPNRKWDPAMLAPSFKAYSEASAWAAKRGADLIVWPETGAAFDLQPTDAYPWGMDIHAQYRKKLLALAASLHTPILTGAPVDQRGGRRGHDEKPRLPDLRARWRITLRWCAWPTAESAR